MGSSFLDVQSQVLSQLHDSHPCTCLVCWASVRTIHRPLALLFLPLGLHAVALCRAFPLGGSAVSSSPLAGEHSPVSCRAPLFAALPQRGSQLSAVTSFCFAGPPAFPLGLRSFIVDLVPQQRSFLRGLLYACSQFPSASSSLSQCSLGCEAVVSSRLCQVECSSCFQHREIHLTHPWCR